MADARAGLKFRNLKFRNSAIVRDRRDACATVVKEVREMAQVKITVRMNGPFRVEAEPGSLELVDANGAAFDLSAKVKDGKMAFSLCRCGGSVNKPFCDGTHSKIGFQAAEAAVRAEEGGAVSKPVENNPPASSPAKG